ncbi:hypothetical protein D3C87_38510 [compost metagenome]
MSLPYKGQPSAFPIPYKIMGYSYTNPTSKEYVNHPVSRCVTLYVLFSLNRNKAVHLICSTTHRFFVSGAELPN